MGNRPYLRKYTNPNVGANAQKLRLQKIRWISLPRRGFGFHSASGTNNLCSESVARACAVRLLDMQIRRYVEVGIKAMNKARAMLDALMGPNRNEKEHDKDKAAWTQP